MHAGTQPALRGSYHVPRALQGLGGQGCTTRGLLGGEREQLHADPTSPVTKGVEARSLSSLRRIRSSSGKFISVIQRTALMSGAALPFLPPLAGHRQGTVLRYLEPTAASCPKPAALM
ncbi:hypothetical protein CB1_000216042 [Camelus ferus]|nr:hypothetical protein CB1_000216042 [Camelus ferus]